MRRRPQLPLLTLMLALFGYPFTGYHAAAQAGVAPQRAPLKPAFVEHQKKMALRKARSTAPVDPAKPWPASLPRHGLGYSPSPIDFSHLKSGSAARYAVVGAFPASFNLRDQGKVTPVRDQGYCGSCWSFAAFGSAESNLLVGENLDFSENNLKNKAGFDWGPCDGGNELMSTAYLSRWSGPVAEADDSYNADSGVSPQDLPIQKHYQEVIFLPARSGPTDNDAIKQALTEYGAVTTYYYHDFGAAYFKEASSGYYYTGATRSANHAVTIVGWDDNLSSGNFVTPPPGNGAFIIKNSWGTGWGENGYFYISYYDPNLAMENDIGDSDANYVFVEPAASDNFNKVYQYDPLGLTQLVGYYENHTAWFANIFTATASDNLSAVSFYALAANASYELFIYTNSGTGPQSGSLMSSSSGTLTHAGYHTITLPSPVALTGGQKFSVVVKLATPGYNYPIPLESPVPGYASQTSATAGESFVSADGSDWDDVTTFFADSNVCIKAFTSAPPANFSPTVTQTAPADQAVRVPATSTISATFSKSMDAATITPVSFHISNGVTGTVSYDPGTRVATFTPSRNLPPSTRYTATITTAVQDTEGNAMAAERVWSFTTAPSPNGLAFDELPEEFLPVPNGYGGLNWTYTMVMNPALSYPPGSGYMNARLSSPNVATNSHGNGITVSSAQPFTFYGAYLTAAVSNGLNIRVHGYRNGTLTKDSTVVVDTTKATFFRFNYADIDTLMMDPSGGDDPANPFFLLDNIFINYAPPAITSSSPAADATNVAIYEPITVTFSNPMDGATISDSTFTLDQGVTGTVGYDAAHQAGYFLPSQLLLPNTTYTATIGTGVKNLDGTPLPAQHVWSFTTGGSYTVSGTVHGGTASGPPLAGALVSIGERTATTSDAGTFTVTALPTGTHPMTISKTGYLTHTNPAYPVSGDQSVNNLYLRPTYSITGAVHHWVANGPSLAGATLSITGGDLPSTVTAVSAQDGSFTWPGIPAGTYTVEIYKNGYLTFTNATYQVAGNQSGINFFLVPVSYTVSGTLHVESPNGSALYAATVTMSGPALLAPVTAVTSSTGTFTLRGIPAGNYTLTISKSGYVTSTDTDYGVDGTQNGLQFYLKRSYAMSGYVRVGSAAGPGLLGAVIRLDGQVMGSTNSSGFFSFTGVAAGNYALLVEKVGYTDYSTNGYSVTGNQSNLIFVVQTVPTPNLAPYRQTGWSDKIVVGRSKNVTYNTSSVFYSNEQLYIASSAKNIGTASTTSGFQMALYVDGADIAWGLSPALAATGVTSWMDVPLGPLAVGQHTIKLVVDTPDMVLETNESDNSYTKTITVTAPPTYTISGTVRSGTVTGAVIAGAAVTLGNKSATTGSTGMFSITGVQAGSYPLTIAKTGFVTYSNDAYLVRGSQSGTYALQTTPTPNLAPGQPQGWSDKLVIAKTAGVISNSNNQFYSNNQIYVASAATNKGTAPAAPFKVDILVDGVKKGEWSAAGLAVNASATGTNIAIGQLAVGTHTVRMLIDSGSAIAETNESDNSYSKVITVVAPPTYVISGTVVSGSLTGAGVAGATVTLGNKTATTGSTGAFFIAGVPAGSYTMTIAKAGYVTYSNEAFVVSGAGTAKYVLTKLVAELKLELVPNPASGAGSWQYALTLTETKGVGVKITSIVWNFKDAGGNSIGTLTSDASYFANWFGGGSSAIPASGTAGGTISNSLGGRTSGSVVITFNGTDDYNNSITVSGVESLIPPPQLSFAAAKAATSLTAPRVWK